MKWKKSVTLSAALTALLVVVVALNSRTYISQGAEIPSVAVKQPYCKLCNIRPASSPENDLSVLLINSSNQFSINLVQYTQDGKPSDHGIFVSNCGAEGDTGKGCHIQKCRENLVYGQTKMVVIPGKEYPPDRVKLCADCYAAVQQASPHYDLLLIDHRGQRIYDLCEKPYDFYIREYHIMTRPKRGGSVQVTINDMTIYSKELSPE